MRTAAYWMEKLQLQKHPEGGYFRETYRASEEISADALPARFTGSRCFSTAIYFLLTGTEFSAFHRIKSDELWHFYAGSPLTLYIIDANGEYRSIVLGDRLKNGETFQAVVNAGCWFAAQVTDAESYTLVGCTVAPGFDFADFEIGQRAELCKLYPKHKEIITRLTR